MMRAGRIVASIFLAIPGMVTHAFAQVCWPQTTDVFTTVATLEARAPQIWRSIDLGNVGLRACGGRAWGDPAKGSMGLLIGAEALTSLGDRTELADLLRAGTSVLYRISDSGALAFAHGDFYHRPAFDGAKNTAEVGASIRFPVPKWFPERHPLALLEFDRDVWQDNTTYTRAALRMDYKFAVRMGALIEVGHAWSDHASSNLRSHGTDVTLTLQRAPDPANIRDGKVAVLEVFMQTAWSHLNSCGTVASFGVRRTSTR